MSGLSWPVPELRVAEVDRRLRFSAASADESDNKTLMTVTDWDDEQRSAFSSGTAILIDADDASDPHGRGNLPREGALPLAGSLLSVQWPPRRRHSWICRYLIDVRIHFIEPATLHLMSQRQLHWPEHVGHFQVDAALLAQGSSLTDRRFTFGTDSRSGDEWLPCRQIPLLGVKPRSGDQLVFGKRSTGKSLWYRIATPVAPATASARRIQS